MRLSILIISTIILFAVELLYFKIAGYYNIIDKPNHRSSHNKVTIRGGGIIFPVAILLYSLYAGFTYPYFLFGLLIISFVSFIDDISELSSKIRILFHLVAVTLLFYQTSVFSLPVYWILLASVFVIGTINAINFMDGINGITGGYGLIALATLYYINSSVALNFTSVNFLIVAISAVLVFNFFNFRTKAKCFAGDVGSVSLAFIIVFFITQLIMKTENINYLLLLLLYGLDAFTTIVFRIIRKENIFDAHRSHFYQFLANEKKIPHLTVSILYIVVQIIFNIIIIYFLHNSVMRDIIFLTGAFILFVLIRINFEGSELLFARDTRQLKN